MGFLKKLLQFGKSDYLINRDVLARYIDEQIEFSKENYVSFADEFFLFKNDDEKNKIRINIINYDVPDEYSPEEMDMHGIVIYAGKGKNAGVESGKKYYTSKDLIDFELIDLPEYFVLRNELCDPVSLEHFKINN